MTTVNLKNVIWQEGNDYISLNLNTGVSSFGDTKEEALESLQEALELYFEDTPLSKTITIERADIVPLEFQHA